MNRCGRFGGIQLVALLKFIADHAFLAIVQVQADSSTRLKELHLSDAMTTLPSQNQHYLSELYSYIFHRFFEYYYAPTIS